MGDKVYLGDGVFAWIDNLTGDLVLGTDYITDSMEMERFCSEIRMNHEVIGALLMFLKRTE